VSRKLTAAQHKRAARLFELAATRVDQSLGKRGRDVSTVRTLEAEERGWYAQSFNDGDCEDTLELTAVQA